MTNLIAITDYRAPNKITFVTVKEAQLNKEN